jgi:hypothetical protein
LLEGLPLVVVVIIVSITVVKVKTKKARKLIVVAKTAAIKFWSKKWVQ